MTFDEYQKFADYTAVYPDEHNISYPALGLAGEAGEVANKVKKIYRDDDGEPTSIRKAEIGKEIGGVLWYCAALASDLGLSLGDIARMNVEILRNRQQRGVLKGSGDNR